LPLSSTASGSCGKESQIGFLRSDSAAYQADSINYCKQDGIQCAIGADLDEEVVGAIRAMPDNEWELYKHGYIAETFIPWKRLKSPSVLS
jgi:hypothetical protein